MKPFASQITFLNFRDFEQGKQFMSQVLQLEAVYDIGWAVVYGIAGKAFLGAVDHSSGHRASGQQDGMLISLTTDSIGPWHDHIARYLEVSPIREIGDAGLRSFFFTGPEGYQFEIQQFTREGPIRLFD